MLGTVRECKSKYRNVVMILDINLLDFLYQVGWNYSVPFILFTVFCVSNYYPGWRSCCWPSIGVRRIILSGCNHEFSTRYGYEEIPQ